MVKDFGNEFSDHDAQLFHHPDEPQLPAYGDGPDVSEMAGYQQADGADAGELAVESADAAYPAETDYPAADEAAYVPDLAKEDDVVAVDLSELPPSGKSTVIRNIFDTMRQHMADAADGEPQPLVFIDYKKSSEFPREIAAALEKAGGPGQNEQLQRIEPAAGREGMTPAALAAAYEKVTGGYQTTDSGKTRFIDIEQFLQQHPLAHEQVEHLTIGDEANVYTRPADTQLPYSTDSESRRVMDKYIRQSIETSLAEGTDPDTEAALRSAAAAMGIELNNSTQQEDEEDQRRTGGQPAE
jgi:hypothetical protein